MKLRIIAGSLKGRFIKFPESKEIRPTLERLRESLFNICQEKIVDARFLDLFAGTGIVGIEAASRGAKEVVLVDKSRTTVQMIKKNVKELSLEGIITTLQMDARNFAKDQQATPFDIVFIDPPYALGPEYINALLQEIDAMPNFLADDGWIFIEEDQKQPSLVEEKSFTTLQFVKKRASGQSQLLHFSNSKK